MVMKVAIITGAAQGVGQTTARVLAARGYSLALNDLRSPDETLAEVGGEAIGIAGDISDESVAERLAAAVRERFGRADLLVNNAGIALIATVESTSPAAFRRVLEVNLVAPFLLCRAFAPLLLEAGGTVVNVASIAGLTGIADRAAYNASKHGLIGLTRTLAAEWGGRGVRVNAVCPGWIKTPMDDVDQAKGTYSDGDITGRVPMGRFATAEDVARAIAFLADPVESGFVNGHTLVIDGGWTADGSWQSLRASHRRPESG